MAETLTVEKIISHFPDYKKLHNLYSLRDEILGLMPFANRKVDGEKFSQQEWAIINLIRLIQETNSVLPESLDNDHTLAYVERCIQMAPARKKDMM
jgi:hypothetical protein